MAEARSVTAEKLSSQKSSDPNDSLVKKCWGVSASSDAAITDRRLCSSEDTRFYSLIFFFSSYEILLAGFAFNSKFYVSIWSFTSSGDLSQLAEILQFMKSTFHVKFLPLFRWNSKLVTVLFSAGCLLTERGSLWRGQLPENQTQPLCAHFCQLIAIPLMPGHCWDLQAPVLCQNRVCLVFFFSCSQTEDERLFCWLWQLQWTPVSLQQGSGNADLSCCNKGHRRELFCVISLLQWIAVEVLIADFCRCSSSLCYETRTGEKVPF